MSQNLSLSHFISVIITRFIKMPNAGLLVCLRGILLVLGFNHILFAYSLNIHKYLSDEEICSIFNIPNATQVPEYEIVEIFHDENFHRSRKTRSASTQLQLQAFGRNLTLYLEPNDHVLLDKDTPVFGATKDYSQPFGVKYTRLENVWSNDFETYQDPKNHVAVAIYGESEGYVNVDGTIGDDIVIKPLPPKVQYTLKNYFPASRSGFKNQPSNFGNNNPETQVTHHVVYKPTNNPITDGIVNIFDAGTTLWNNLFGFRRTNYRSKRAIFDTVYPQLLIIVDYETFKIHNYNVEKLSKYMAAFWNGVDLRYRNVNDPKVRLNIAGIIITQEKDAIPYIKYHQTESNLIEDRTTLEALGKYLHEEKRFLRETFDIAVAITGINMCVKKPNNCSSSSIGLAYNGGACKHDVGQLDVSIAILLDSGGFNGIITAAHELGHLLGAPHDGDDSLSYIGGPGAKSCSWDDGYLMSSNRRNIKGIQWSSCSIKALQHFLQKEAYCLRDKPVVKSPLKKILPGTVLSRDEQCGKARNMIECKVTRGDCGSLWCVGPNGMSNCVLSGSPAEGSSCYNGGICLDGHCVPKQENFLSVYITEPGQD